MNGGGDPPPPWDARVIRGFVVYATALAKLGIHMVWLDFNMKH